MSTRPLTHLHFNDDRNCSSVVFSLEFLLLIIFLEFGGLQPKKNRTLSQISNLGLVFFGFFVFFVFFFGFFGFFRFFHFWSILTGLTGSC